MKTEYTVLNCPGFPCDSKIIVNTYELLQGKNFYCDKCGEVISMNPDAKPREKK